MRIRVVVEALREIGIDASDHVPRLLDEERIHWSDQIVSTCQEEVCPVTFGKPRTSWEFPDPEEPAARRSASDPGRDSRACRGAAG